MSLFIAIAIVNYLTVLMAELISCIGKDDDKGYLRAIFWPIYYIHELVRLITKPIKKIKDN